MRLGYRHGAPGVLVSGLVWGAAAAVAWSGNGSASVLVLILGGALIFPLSLLLTKVLGHAAAHTKGNPLGRLAMEGTFWMLAGIAVAYALHFLQIEWFFPAMLLAIGGRYLSFQSLYGLRIYWLLGALLCVAGFASVLLRAPLAVGATLGTAIELVFAGVLFLQARAAARV